MSSVEDDPELERVLEILRRKQREGGFNLDEFQHRLSDREPRQAANDALPPEVLSPSTGVAPTVEKKVDKEAEEYFSYLNTIKLHNLADRSMTAEDRLDAFERTLDAYGDDTSLEDQMQAVEAMELAVAREMQRVEKAWEDEMEPIVANAKRSEAASTAALNPKDTLDNRLEAAGRAQSYNGVVHDQMSTSMREVGPALAAQSMQRLEGVRGFDPDAHAVRLQQLMKPPQEVAISDRRLDAARDVVARHQKGRDHDQVRQYDHDQTYLSQMAPR